MLFSSISVFFLFLAALSGSSKYSMLGCIRIISQLIAFELLLGTIFMISIWSFNDITIANYLVMEQDRLDSITLTHYAISPLLSICYVVCILAECNRIPFDLPEAESELVAGFQTEYSSIYFSVIVLAEYANIIIMSMIAITVLGLNISMIITIVTTTALIRASLNRLKFDELMTTC